MKKIEHVIFLIYCYYINKKGTISKRYNVWL